MADVRAVVRRMLGEDLPLTPEESEATYYHGTTREDFAKAIMQSGIKGRDTQGRAFAAPRAGFVYLPRKIVDALPYALGGVTMGTSTPQSFIGKDGRYGYVFVIEGEDLTDIEPDEDHVGKLVYKLSRKETLSPEEDRFLVYAKYHLTPQQYQRIRDGEWMYWASGGKRLLKRMPGWMVRFALDRVDVVANRGVVMPSEAWRIDKKRSKELVPDGSNFFEVAEKVWER